jgi:hypothetical protein
MYRSLCLHCFQGARFRFLLDWQGLIEISDLSEADAITVLNEEAKCERKCESCFFVRTPSFHLHRQVRGHRN